MNEGCSSHSRMRQVVGSERVVARIYGQSLYAYGNRGLEEVLYQDLRLKEAGGLDTTHNQQITLEDLQQLNPDRILIAVCPEAISRRFWLALQHSAKWQTLELLLEAAST